MDNTTLMEIRRFVQQMQQFLDKQDSLSEHQLGYYKALSAIGRIISFSEGLKAVSENALHELEESRRYEDMEDTLRPVQADDAE